MRRGSEPQSSIPDTVPPWARLILLNWPAASWARFDCAVAAAEIAHVISRNPPNDSELCAVVRWMAGPEGRQEKAPSLRELIRAVFIQRKAARQESESGGDGQSCAICQFAGGWAHHWPDWREDWAAVHYWAAYCVAVPCVCQAGEALFNRRDTKLIRSDAFSAMRHQAVRQCAALLRVEAAITGAAVPALAIPSRAVFVDAAAEFGAGEDAIYE